VHRRTIFRDLDMLREAGVPVDYDQESESYSVAGSVAFREAQLDAHEALALLTLCQQLGGKQGLPFLGAARSAALKLESTLPPQLRDYLQSASRGVQIRLEPKHALQGQDATYQQVVQAIAARRAIRIQYRSLTEWETIQTKLHPYRVWFSRRSWYVVGRSSFHRAARTFHLGRIVKLETLDERFRMPAGFSLRRYLRNAWHMIPERGVDQDVRIRFQKMVAQNVAEVVWHRTQKLVWNDDGTLDFTVRVSGLNEISWWVLGYGDQAEVMAPAELRQLVATRCARALAQYGDAAVVSEAKPAKKTRRRKTI
jgi:predicted DNA-binding transcriptional regulator YafY